MQNESAAAPKKTADIPPYGPQKQKTERPRPLRPFRLRRMTGHLTKPHACRFSPLHRARQLASSAASSCFRLPVSAARNASTSLSRSSSVPAL